MDQFLGPHFIVFREDEADLELGSGMYWTTRVKLPSKTCSMSCCHFSTTAEILLYLEHHYQGADVLSDVDLA